jgi:hypothetical protein
MMEDATPTPADAPWSDPRFVVEGLEAASCGPHAKTLAIEGIAIAEEGGTAEEWRAAVAERHLDHPGWREHLAEAERCMRASGIWPWPASDPTTW